MPGEGGDSVHSLNFVIPYLLVGTQKDLQLWSLTSPHNPRLVNKVTTGEVWDCALSYPHAVCTGDIISNKGLQVWDLVRGEKMRHL